MDIQPIQDLDAQNATAPSPSATVMPMPETPSPRNNPLAMLWRRRNILAIVTLVCVAAAFVKYWFTPAVYRSEARLFVQMPAAATGTGTEKSTTGTLQGQCSLLTSRLLLTEVSGDPEIARMKTFESGQRGKILEQNLKATVDKDSDIINLAFDTHVKAEARPILHRVVQAYQEFHSQKKNADIKKLERWRREKQVELDTAQKKLLKFKQDNSALWLSGDKGNLAMQTLSNLREAYDSAHRTVLENKSALDYTRGKIGDTAQLKQLLDSLRSSGAIAAVDPNETALRTQLMSMEQQLDELRRRYLDQHPAVRAAEATVASIRARVGEMERAAVMGHIMTLEQRLAAAKTHEAELQADLEKQTKAATELSAKAAEAEQMQGEVNRLTKIVEETDMKIITLTTAESVGVPTIQVFDDPSEPGAPVSPLRDRMLLTGLIIGLILGCFAAVVRDLTDQGLRSTEEIAQALGVPLLGAVPHMPGPPNPLAHGRKVDLEPASEVAESYRTIRTSVFFGTPERESRTILVTSPSAADGKSTFASNLAIAMAQTGKRVVLVDADFRRPVQHRVFECRPGAGLSTILTGKDSLDQAIQNSGIASLDVLPCGPVPTNPAEILNSQSFAEVLEELSVRYEHVVLDAPPVLGTPDARILAAMCSVSILVLRPHNCTRRTAIHARNALQSVGAQILGVVVNDVPSYGEPEADFGPGFSPKTRSNGTASPDASGSSRTAIIPAKSFLDLRRK